ncbi:MAG: nucleotidyltransferase family protein [Desulfurococcales archaeon]|nr:nucleotidyltransferase family protein [Desulfurococcales archaeon]
MAPGRVVAAILAGGEGRRFRPYTEIIPKPMMPVGPEEKPILEHIIQWLSRHGIRDIILLVGYRWRQIRNYFRDGGYWGVTIRYSVDTDEYRDTGGALVNAYRRGLIEGYDRVLVWYGDILASVNVSDLLSRHEEWGADATLVLASRYQVPVGVAALSPEGDIVELQEKPWLDLKVTIGVLVLESDVIPRSHRALGNSFDIMSHMIPWMIREGMKVRAYIYEGPWYDVGSMERYAKFDPAILQGFIS